MKTLQLQYKQQFCPIGIDPYDGLSFVLQDAENLRITVPDTWSPVAVSILARNYARKARVPSKVIRIAEPGIPSMLYRSEPAPDASFGAETDARQIINRIAGGWAYHAAKAQMLDERAAVALYNDARWLMIRQYAAPNSPQWFNNGLYWAYGITGDKNGLYRSTDGVTATEVNTYESPQLSACFILELEDKLVGKNSIQDWLHNETLVFKGGSGAGVNASKLRGEGEPLSGGGTSSGLISFLKVADRNAGSIKSGGTTRRAAKMIVLDDDHPDVINFVKWKASEENTVAMLHTGSTMIRFAYDLLKNAEATERNAIGAKMVAHGFNAKIIDKMVTSLNQGIELTLKDMPLDYTSDAYNTVSGQNENHSIRLSDALMEAAKNGGKWNLIRRTDGGIASTHNAADILHEILVAAWESGDPGWQYGDAINHWHTHKGYGDITASNPCSEYLSVGSTACNLASINLVKFLDDNGWFNADAFIKACRVWTLILELTVALSSYPTPDIAINTYKLRNLGLGYANLGGLLMRMGLAYDSDEARQLAGAINAIQGATAYRASAEMAATWGPCQGYIDNALHMNRVIDLHAHAAGLHLMLDATPRPGTHRLDSSKANREGKRLIKIAQRQWELTREMVFAYGTRNMQGTVTAPAGTIGLVMDCDTTGIEPDFALLKMKRLADGKFMSIVNASVEPALTALGYNADQRADVAAYVQEHNSIVGAPHVRRDHYAVFACSTGSDAISPMGHMKMLAACQPFVSGAISKSINVPETATLDDLKQLAYYAHENGVKAFTIYRENSKLSQPLSRANANDLVQGDIANLFRFLDERADDDLAIRAVEQHEVTCPKCASTSLVATGTCAICTSCGTALGGCG